MCTVEITLWFVQKICSGIFELIDIIWSKSCLEVLGLSFRLEPPVFAFGLHLQHHWSHIPDGNVLWSQMFVTLTWAVSCVHDTRLNAVVYKANVVKTAAVLKSRNCLLFKLDSTRMWADAQRDGRAVEYRWRPLFNAAKFGRRALLEYRAVTLPRRESGWN